MSSQDHAGFEKKPRKGEKSRKRVACKLPQPVIYSHHGWQYDELVGYQDHHGDVGKALESLFPDVFNDQSVVADLGAGSGRLAAMVAGRVKEVKLVDNSAHMLDVARKRMSGLGHGNCSFYVADHRDLSAITDHSVDAIIAGWTLSHLKKPVRPWKEVEAGNQHYWREDIDQAFVQMRGILRPRGSIVILETLGTAVEAPQRNSYYYTMLQEMGFERTEIRTDYRFPNLQIAKDMANFFWGPGVADRINSVEVPEFTAMFVKRNAFSDE